jgi:TolB-like protein
MYVLFGGGGGKDVPAAFGDLAGHSVAVVVFTGPKVQFEHPYARLNLTEQIAAELEARVNGVEVVEPAKVLAFQERNVNWDVTDKTRLGRELGADYVLFVAVVEYTSREKGSVSLYRGRVTAEASVWQSSLPEARARLWYDPAVSDTYPSESKGGLLAREARGILERARQKFVDRLVKNFYAHPPERQP